MPLDAVAHLMLDEAGPLPPVVLVVEDAGGALTRAALEAGATVRTCCDDLADELAVPEDCRIDALTPEALAGVELVLWRLPKALGAVEETAQALAAAASTPGLRVVAGGRVKHMTRAQNDVLGRSFADVRASLGRQKSRVLHAAGPRPGPARWPQRRPLPELGLEVVAHGAAFATNRLDAGTALLVRALDDARPDPGPVAVDLGCGSGILAAWLAGHGFEVTGTDVSRAAVASTRATAAASGVRVEAVRAVGLTGWAPGSVDLVVTNPPFHRGTAKETTDTLAMFSDAGHALAPGGELWVVWNAHLPYLPELRRRVGPTTIEARDRSYVVTRSLRRPARAARLTQPATG